MYVLQLNIYPAGFCALPKNNGGTNPSKCDVIMLVSNPWHGWTLAGCYKVWDKSQGFPDDTFREREKATLFETPRRGIAL